MTSGEVQPSDGQDVLSLTPVLSRWERGKLRRPLALLEHAFANQRGGRVSLSQRERAGVRENAPLPVVTDTGNEKGSNTAQVTRPM